MGDNEAVSKDATFAGIVAEAGGFYKSVLTVASSFLGGSLVFMQRIAPNPSTVSLIVLGIGWVLLVACVAVVVFVRRLNLDSGRQALRSEYAAAEKIDQKTRGLSNWATWLLIGGIFMVMLFGMMNVWGSGQNQENKAMTCNPGGPGDERTPEQRTIPFGSTGSEGSDQKEQKPATTESTPAEQPDTDSSTQEQNGASSSDKN